MKFFVLFLFVGWISSPVHATAQKQRVSLDLKDCTVIDFFRILQEKTSLYFVYNTKNFQGMDKIDVKTDDEPVSELLKRVFSGKNLEFEFENNTVVVKPSSSVPQKSTTVKGVVKDTKGNPLPGVTVLVKGTTVGGATDAQGTFSLTLPKMENLSLLFSFIGMEAQEVKFTGQQEIQVVMKELAAQLDEVVVSTGYQQIDLRKTTSAIQSIKAEDIMVPGLNSVDQMLEGYVPGMIFMQNSGQVGAAPRLRIRGTSTVLGSQEPLWVIDGIVQQDPVDVDPQQINDLDFVNLLGNAITGLNPEDIAQIDILKDASATALYGARAANGVIVVTTKRGKQGPPSLSYSLSGTFMRRPHYSDKSVNMMNSKERINYSRELIEDQVAFPTFTSWVGYEKPLRDYWRGEITFDEMQKEVGYYESVNTDWFDLLMQNSFSHKHTINLSGGSSALRYYVSAGLTDTRGSIKGEQNKLYTVNANLTANFNRWTMRFGFNGNVAEKQYTPSDVGVTKYAYETTRALPAYNEDGSLWFYERMVDETSNYFQDFSIINEMNNSSQDIRSSGLSVNAVLDYKVTDYLKASVTASYSSNNTTEEIWYGEDTFYALKLKNASGGSSNYLPFGGELQYSNTERYAYLVRAQLDFNKFVDKDEKHLITAAVGGEVSSNQYYGMDKTYRGYLKERGKKMAEVDHDDYPYFADWALTDPAALGIWTDKLTNLASAYGTVSYTYNNLYTLNANVRIDGSNRFGSRANEKLAPIWSLSARWNVKDDVLADTDWLTYLSLRGSFGYQGNMLESQSAQLVIEKGGIDAGFQDYESTIYRYPNPDLKWEKTASYNLTLDFGLFRGDRISGSLSYFYKKTDDAFVSKNISSIYGLTEWVVNGGTLENKGYEASVTVVPVNTKAHNPNGVRWSININAAQVLNKMTGEKDKSLTENITYQDYLDGTAEIQGRPLNSFYSYKFHGLNPANGMPTFYGSEQNQYIGNTQVDLNERYSTMSKSEIFADVMTYSGNRVPTVQGGVQTSLAWRRFTLSVNMTYSLGSKIRLLQMYPEVNRHLGTIAPQAHANVRKEFLNRWRQPGDEKRTNVPGISSGTELTNQLSAINMAAWWGFSVRDKDGQSARFAESIWRMYDQSDLRVVSGDFLKIQSLSVRYNIPDEICKQLRIKSAYIGLSGTNLHTFCHKKVKGQDPATQSGTAPMINMSLRPTYSFNLNVSF